MSKTFQNMRKQIDDLDSRIHDLLMERAELVSKIAAEKKKQNMPAIQPHREIQVIRRLMERHHGPLARESIARIWRELVGAVSLLQTDLKAIIYVPEDHEGIKYWDKAKDYFSSVVPMQKVSNPMSAFAAVREGEATFGVVPWPVDTVDTPWWSYLFDEEGPEAMRIVARLPLADRKASDSAPEFQALVIARLRFGDSGDDRSFIGLDLKGDISRARIVEIAKEMDFEPLGLYTSPGRMPGRKWHMLEVGSYVDALDSVLDKLSGKFEDTEARAVLLGGYPKPPVYNDKVGKAVVSVSFPEAESSGRSGKKKSA